MSKGSEIFRTLATFFVLIILTLLLLELPRRYYKMEGERRLNEVHMQSYSVNEIGEDMTIEQKIRVLEMEDGIVSDAAEWEMTELEKSERKNALIEEIRQMLGYSDVAAIITEILLPEVEGRWFTMQVIHVQDEKIYSYDVGGAVFADDAGVMDGVIIFDMETGKIFLMEIFSDALLDADLAFSYIDEKERTVVDVDLELTSQMDVLAQWLSDYYGREVTPYDSFVDFSGYEILCSPFSDDFYQAGGRNTFYRMIEKIYAVWE